MSILRIALASLAFVSLGLPDGLLGVAWPSIRHTFGLPLDAVGALMAASTAGYVLSSFSSGRALRLMNLGLLLGVSCALTGVALIGYATVPAWSLLVALGVVLGFGAGAIDAALNTYAATRYGHGTLNWLHACYGIGAASGPLLMTAILRQRGPWQDGYLLVAAGQLVLAMAFGATSRWWSSPLTTADSGEHARLRETLRVRPARLGVLVFLLYAGVEASIGLWTFTLLTEGRGLPAAEAAFFVSFFWGGLTAGRLVAAAVAGRIAARPLLYSCVVLVIAGTLLLWMDAHAVVTACGIALCGTACGPIFPTLIATTPERVGRPHAANAVGFQVGAAAAGMAFLPGAIGSIAAATAVSTIASLFVALALAFGLACWRLTADKPHSFARLSA